MNSNCSKLLDMRNLQKQVKKHSVTKNSLLFWYQNTISSDYGYFCNHSKFVLYFVYFCDEKILYLPSTKLTKLFIPLIQYPSTYLWKHTSKLESTYNR
jgi:hypothetical protein